MPAEHSKASPDPTMAERKHSLFVFFRKILQGCISLAFTSLKKIQCFLRKSSPCDGSSIQHEKIQLAV